MEPTDEALVRSFLEAGEGRSFDQLVRRYKDKTYTRCLSYVKNHAAAEDLCQDIFTKIFEKLGSFRGEARFTTWLFTITHNECLDHLRKHKKNMHKVLTEKLADELEEELEEEEVDRDITEESLLIMLEEMSREDKLILLLKYKDKKPIKEIQEVFGLSESAVKMRLKRARERLNKLYSNRI